MNNIRKRSIGILFALAVIAQSCSEKKTETVKSLRPVQYQEVTTLGNSTTRTFSGTARTDKIINLSFRANGIVSELNMELGQKVRKGQLLGKLDNVQSRLNYESSVASLNSAESQMNTAKLSLNRIRSLYEKGSASLSDFESAKNSYKTAQQSYESAKRSVDIQKEQIRYGYLYAPVDGIISAVNIELDENVSTGQNVGVLNAGTDMEIELGLPESVINRVVPNMSVDISFAALTNTSFRGTVTQISPAVDQASATYPVRVTINNPSEVIKSGMAANVIFKFDESSNEKTIIIPAKAVGEDSNGHFVFVIEDGNESSVVKKQSVTIGELTNDGFEITNGLSVGQKIATAGLQTLLDGQEVKTQ